MKGVHSVYVGHIDSRVKTRDLREIFSPFGHVLEVTIISRHGFVNFQSSSDARDAVSSLNGYSLCGRKLHVDYSEELFHYLRKHSRGSSSSSSSLRRAPDPEGKKYSSRRSFAAKEGPLAIREKQIERRRSPAEGDLRDLLQSRKKTEPSKDDTRVEKESEEDKKKAAPPVKKKKKSKTSSKKNIPLQKIYLGNLEHAVERSDILRLFESVGPVVQISMEETHAHVTLECTQEKAKGAVKSLNKNMWMDNCIQVRFVDEGGPSSTSKDEKKSPEDTTKKKAEALNEQETEEEDTNTTESHQETPLRPEEGVVSKAVEEEPQKLPLTSFMADNKIAVERLAASKVKKLRYFLIFSPFAGSKTFIEDMKEVFSRFGSVQDINWFKEGESLLIQSVTTERGAVQCIQDSNQIKYKGTELRVKFANGSDEDMPAFRNKYSIELRHYPSELIPPFLKKQEKKPVIRPPETSNSSSSSMASTAALNKLLKQHNVELVNSRPPSSSEVSVSSDMSYASGLKGIIQSISSKIILIQFDLNGRTSALAKLVPGQMFMNGRTCLGFLIKDNTFHAWPGALKMFCHHGAEVRMDIKRLSEDEIRETRELVGEDVAFSVPLVWKGRKPLESEVLVSRSKQQYSVLKGRLENLYPKWGILTSQEHGPIFFDVTALVDLRCQISRESSSLLNHLALGDVLAVHARSIPQGDEEKELISVRHSISGSPGFCNKAHGRLLEEVKYIGRLVWQVQAEVDPYSVVPRGGGGDSTTEKEGGEEESSSSCRFLISSSTLLSQLPGEKEALYKGYTGILEEIHLPGGGLLLLDSDDGSDERETNKRVYFHRSRVYINGVKMNSSTSLDRELAPGDKALVDFIPNKQSVGSSPYVLSSAEWVALSVHIETTDRGINFARSLKGATEGSNDEGYAQGRIVYLHPPTSDSGPVLSGIAVMDSGDHMGQRVEFDRNDCEVFGQSLKNADLSLLFQFGDKVNICVKPYNSYCVEKLWIGSADTSGEHKLKRKTYLTEHGLDDQSFDSFLRGEKVVRTFLPLRGQPLRGKVSQLLPSKSDESSRKDSLRIKAPESELNLEVEVTRERIFFYGRSLKQADLEHLFQEGDDIYFEIHPVYEKELYAGSDVILAAIAWVGEESHRPNYIGPSMVPELNSRMDSLLNQFLRKNNRTEEDFQLILNGIALKDSSKAKKQQKLTLISPLEVGGGVDLQQIDAETLQQAALLQQMKATFGKKRALQAMMLLLTESEANGATAQEEDEDNEILKMRDKMGEMKRESETKSEDGLKATTSASSIPSSKFSEEEEDVKSSKSIINGDAPSPESLAKEDAIESINEEDKKSSSSSFSECELNNESLNNNAGNLTPPPLNNSSSTITNKSSLPTTITTDKDDIKNINEEDKKSSSSEIEQPLNNRTDNLTPPPNNSSSSSPTSSPPHPLISNAAQKRPLEDFNTSTNNSDPEDQPELKRSKESPSPEEEPNI